MFKIKKNKLVLILLIVIAVTVLTFFSYSIYGYTVAEDYAYTVKDSLVNNVTTEAMFKGTARNVVSESDDSATRGDTPKNTQGA